MEVEAAVESRVQKSERLNQETADRLEQLERMRQAVLPGRPDLAVALAPESNVQEEVAESEGQPMEEETGREEH
jgi:hypothetical protein